MQGIFISFQASGGTINWGTSVQGFDAVVQNALVNIATDLGSDRVLPAKGTELYRQGASGALSDLAAAGHASNFAALATLFFSRASDVDGTAEERLKEIRLNPVFFGLQRAELNGQFTGTLGSARGVTATLLTQ